MKYIKLLLLNCIFLISNVLAAQQNIYGEVLDENNKPLLGATVYLDGTSIGTTTNEKGLFQISIASELNAYLIISYVGYEKFIVSKPKLGIKYKVYLNPKIEKLNEIVLSDGGFSRKQMMKLFKEQFLGLTKAGKKCVIENENEIYFYYDTKNNVFYAYCDVELIINNPYLGYKVFYNLNRFEINFKKYSLDTASIHTSIYSGDSRFVEMDSTFKIKKRRLDAFEGSVTHFMRELSKKKFTDKGFQLYYKSFVTNPNIHFTINDTLGMHKVSVLPSIKPKNSNNKFKKELSILYNKKQQSKVIFHETTFYIDKFGLFSNFENILFSGVLTEKRVGDLLPANFGFE